ncbi:flagella basal body P-ring formation protein FlgA [Caldimonas brevitalea]|uniref:Flagella basal body P-ring formation protein FlgA n=2 Tax=Caldimonas brevitalea TaxID=413882 RepID=A0A0G3BLN5_9BURK|nr:flagella basal body P-ring formation protein FlgA [Caldimonas brevitalea]
MRCCGQAAVCCWLPLTLAAAAPRAEETVEQAARELLQQQAERDGLVNPVFSLTVLTGVRPLPPCPETPTVAPLDTRYPARMRFTVTCSAQTGWSQPVVVRAEVSADVAVTTGAIAAGTPIDPAGLRIERRSITSTPDALSDPQAAAGRASRRPLRAGQVLQQRQLYAPQVIKRGDAVRIVARHEGLEVSSAGEALEAGGQGETVRVRNTRTGKVIRGRITSSTTVEAEISAPMPAHSPD